MMAVIINVVYTDSDTSCFVFITRISHIILCSQVQAGDGNLEESCVVKTTSTIKITTNL